MSAQKDVYIVIGGSGFLGRHIVEALLNRGDTVSVLDIVQRYHDVPFYSADISVQSQVEDAFRKVRRILSYFPTLTDIYICRVGQHASSTLRLHPMVWIPLFTGK